MKSREVIDDGLSLPDCVPLRAEGAGEFPLAYKGEFSVHGFLNRHKIIADFHHVLSRNLGRVVSLTVINEPVFRSLTCRADIKTFGVLAASEIGHHKIPVFKHER